MIKLGKIENGVALFSDIDKTQVLIKFDQTGNGINFNILRNDEADLENNDIHIRRDENKNICDILDYLYSSYRQILRPYFGGFNLETQPNVNEGQIYCEYLNNKNFSSDVENQSLIGITKTNMSGYILSFHKTIAYPEKRNIFYPIRNSAIAKIQSLYFKELKEIASLAITPYPTAKYKYEEAINEDLVINKQKQLKL